MDPLDDLLGLRPQAAPKVKKPKAEPKPKPVKRDSDGAVKRCLDAFYDAFVKKWNRGVAITAETPKSQIITPIIHGAKHGAQFKKLLGTWDETTVLEIVTLFFETRDPEITRRDYSLDFFFTKAQYLRLKAARPTAGDTRTLENIDAAERAMNQK